MDGFRLGCELVDALEHPAPAIAVSIVFDEQRISHAVLAGDSADDDVWLARKTRIATRFNAP